MRLRYSLFAEPVEFADESLRPAVEIANLPSQFPAVGVQQHISGIAVHAELPGQSCIGALEVVVLRRVAREIQLHQFKLLAGVGCEIFGG